MVTNRAAQCSQHSLTDAIERRYGAATEARPLIWCCRLLVLSTVLALLAPSGWSQEIVSNPPAENALREMFGLAGVIFAGQVVAIHTHDGNDAATGVVEVEFAVEDAIRGVRSSSFTLRELAGFASPGGASFSVGQRYLMMLHTASAAGLSSPVGGMDGAIPIRGSKDGLAQLQTSVGAPRISDKLTDGRSVDLRWVATRVERSVSYRISALPSKSPVIANPLVAQQSSAQESGAAISSTVGAAIRPADSSGSESVPYTSIMATLRSWAKGENAVR